MALDGFLCMGLEGRGRVELQRRLELRRCYRAESSILSRGSLESSGPLAHAIAPLRVGGRPLAVSSETCRISGATAGPTSRLGAQYTSASPNPIESSRSTRWTTRRLRRAPTRDHFDPRWDTHYTRRRVFFACCATCGESGPGAEKSEQNLASQDTMYTWRERRGHAQQSSGN